MVSRHGGRCVRLFVEDYCVGPLCDGRHWAAGGLTCRELNVQYSAANDDAERRATVKPTTRELRPRVEIDARGNRMVLRMGVPLPQVPDLSAGGFPPRQCNRTVAKGHALKEVAVPPVSPARCRGLRNEDMGTMNRAQQHAAGLRITRVSLHVAIEDFEYCG